MAEFSMWQVNQQWLALHLANQQYTRHIERKKQEKKCEPRETQHLGT